MKRYWTSLIFLVGVLLFSSAQADANTAPQNGAQASAQENQVPDPMNLRPSWWKYYDVSGDLLIERVNASIEYYNSFATTLSKETYAKVKPLIDRITSSLLILPDLQKKAPIPPLKQEKWKETYSFDEFILLGRKLQENEQQFKILKLQVDVNDESLRTNNKFLDTLVAAYLLESPNSPNRLMNGLEIIAEKLGLTIDEFQLDYLQKLSANQSELVQRNRQEIDFARKHLVLTNEQKNQIIKEVEQAREDLSLSVSKVFQAQLSYTKSYTLKSNSPEEKSISTQNLIHAMILESLAQINLVNKEIEEAIFKLFLQEGKRDLAKLRRTMTIWEQQIAKIQRLIPDWQEGSSLEMERTLNALAYLEQPTTPIEKAAEESYHTLLNQIQQTFLGLQKVENELFIGDFLLVQMDWIIKEKYASFLEEMLDKWNAAISYIADHSSWFRESFFKFGNTPITPRAIFKVIFILIVGFLLAKFTQNFLVRIGKKHSLLNESALYTLSRLAYFSIMIVGFFVAITSVGIEFTAFAFIAGAITFWIGFGLLSIIQNFVSGVIILLDKNLTVGDFIILDSGEKGVIKDISIRSTIIETLDGYRIVIPNADLVIKKFTNKTSSETMHRLSIPFKIPYYADRKKTIDIVIEAAQKIPYTRSDRVPQVWIDSFGDKNLNLFLVVWVNSSLLNKQTTSIDSIYLFAIDTAMIENQIPQPESK